VKAKKPNIFKIILGVLRQNLIVVVAIAFAISFVVLNSSLFNVRASEKVVDVTITAQTVSRHGTNVLVQKDYSFGDNESLDSSDLNVDIVFDGLNSCFEYVYDAQNISSHDAYLEVKLRKDKLKNIKIQYLYGEEVGSMDNGFFRKIRGGESINLIVRVSIEDAQNWQEDEDGDVRFDFAGSVSFGVTNLG